MDGGVDRPRSGGSRDVVPGSPELLGSREPYRDRLALLASGGVVEAHLAAWAAEQARAPAGVWRRDHARLRPGHSPWAVLVYAADDGTTAQVRLFESGEHESAVTDAGWRTAGVLGRMEIVRCEADPALPGLSAVLDALESPRVVRYRPGSRCTVRGRTPSGLRFVKILSGEIDDQKEARARWESTVSGALSFAVAEPRGWDVLTRSSWYAAVPGGPVLPVLARAGDARLARKIGGALGQLAVAPLRPTRRTDAADQLTRMRRALARAVAAAPQLADELAEAADVLAVAHEHLSARPLVPVHGAAHLGQWLVDGSGRLGLVDFDRFALGEPEFDLATFCVDLRAEASAIRLPVDELVEAVLDGYRTVAGEFDQRRLQVYTVHKRLARAARSATAARPDAAKQAARHLRALREPLADLGKS